MTNLLLYEDCERIKITDIDGEVFEGYVTDVLCKEEQSDLCKQEDEISILTDDKRYLGFYQSEIKDIEIIKQ
ncbi:MAG: hypothetical protein IJK60_03405 [Clostridia bacterium]|nr:hypothetical protein [Clostridia bacterium]